MQNVVADGLRDYITSANFKLESNGNLQPLRYRAKVKAGVTTLRTTGLTGMIWAIDRGAGAHVERNSTTGLACGQYVTIYFYPNTANFRFGNYVTNANLGAFLTQFDKVYDALPEYTRIIDSTPVVIDSPNFEAPEGLFDTPEINNMVFAGSTFKVGPRIFTEKVMEEFQQFPSKKTTTPWAPFAGCPNIEKIEPQGEFGRLLDILWPCDFTYYDHNGFGKLDAYPRGGSPVYVREFVNATKVRITETFPIFDSSRLKKCIRHFKIDTLVIDPLGATREIPMPFGGIDFYGIDMDILQMPLQKWKIEMEEVKRSEPELLNFTWGWAHFGVAAPNSCKNLSNLHTLWTNVEVTGAPVEMANHAQLTAMYANWGYTLRDYIESRPEAFTDDGMPLVPSGIIRSEGHYRKYLVGHEDEVDTKPPKMLSLKTPSKYNNVTRYYQVQSLPETAAIVIGYACNLYSDLIIEADITVPSMPAGWIYQRDCYKRTFYNAVGPSVPLTPSDTLPTLLIAWSKTDNAGRPDWHLIADADDTYNGNFKTCFDNATTRVLYRKNGWDADDVINSESWTSYTEMVNAVKTLGSGYIMTNKITSTITLERQTFGSVQYSGGWQKECFFGSGIDPTQIDALIPFPGVHEWDSYVRALNVFIGYTYNQPLIFYTGRLHIPKEAFLETDRKVNFLMMVGYGSYDSADFDPYTYHLDDVLWSGPARTEGTEIIKPYQQATSEQTIIGDRTTWLPAHGIALTDPDSFSSGSGTGIKDYVSFRGSPMGINASFFVDDADPLTYSRRGWLFQCSYRAHDGTRFQGKDLEPTTEWPFFYEDPLWVDSDSMRRGPQTEYAINSQADLDAAEASINNHWI